MDHKNWCAASNICLLFLGNWILDHKIIVFDPLYEHFDTSCSKYIFLFYPYVNKRNFSLHRPIRFNLIKTNNSKTVLKLKMKSSKKTFWKMLKCFAITDIKNSLEDYTTHAKPSKITNIVFLFQILDLYPTIEITAKVQLLDDNGDTFMCFLLPISIQP